MKAIFDVTINAPDLMLKDGKRIKCDVFISYANKDKIAADAICAALEANQIRCWIAPRDILPGMDYGETIVKAINDCQILVLVFTAKANASEHVKNEVEKAVSEEKPIIPIRVKNILPTGSLALHLSRRQWIDAVTPPLKKHLKRIAESIKFLLSVPEEIEEKVVVPTLAQTEQPCRFDTPKKETKTVEDVVPSGKKTSTFYHKKFLIPLTVLIGVAVVAITLWIFIVRPTPVIDPVDFVEMDDEFLEPIEHEEAPGIKVHVEPKEIKIPTETPPAPPIVAERPVLEPEIKEEPGLSPSVTVGIDAFKKGKYDKSIRQMEEVLGIDPENIYALYYLSEAKKKLETFIQPIFESAKEAYEKGYYRECIEHLENILHLDPENAPAKEYLNLARTNLSQQQIHLSVHRYVRSVENNDLLDFYKTNCFPLIYEELKNDIQLILRGYHNLYAEASDISIRFIEMDRAEVTFFFLKTGVPIAEEKRQILFDGKREWIMVNEGEEWKIEEINFKSNK